MDFASVNALCTLGWDATSIKAIYPGAWCSSDNLDHIFPNEVPNPQSIIWILVCTVECFEGKFGNQNGRLKCYKLAKNTQKIPHCVLADVRSTSPKGTWKCVSSIYKKWQFAKASRHKMNEIKGLLRILITCHPVAVIFETYPLSRWVLERISNKKSDALTCPLIFIPPQKF